MNNPRYTVLILTVMLCTGGLILVGPAVAQSFSELDEVQAQQTESNVATEIPSETVSDATNTAIPSDTVTLLNSDNPPEPMFDAGDEDLKKLMDPKEYEQFMAAKNYSEKNSTYTLGSTDVIEVAVMRHPEVSGKYIINKEGKIQYEFIGDVQLAGLTKEQASEMLAKSLSTYIVNPQVTVKISEYNSKIVFVVGEVARPGRIIMRGDTITIREALLEAGLPLLTAKTTQASMFTPMAGNVKRKRVDIDALLYKGDLRQNFIMKPGDTLYVPATFWAKAMRVISPISQPIGSAASAGSAVATGN